MRGATKPQHVQATCLGQPCFLALASMCSCVLCDSGGYRFPNSSSPVTQLLVKVSDNGKVGLLRGRFRFQEIQAMDCRGTYKAFGGCVGEAVTTNPLL